MGSRFHPALAPGTRPAQEALLRRLHGGLEGALPSLTPLHLATALWAVAAVGVQARWADDLLQRVRAGCLRGCHFAHAQCCMLAMAPGSPSFCPLPQQLPVPPTS